MEEYQNKNEWLESLHRAIKEADASEAYRAARAWPEFIGQPIEFPQADQYTESLRQNTLLTAFPLLSEKLADLVLQVLTRSFFTDNQYQLPAKQKIENRFLFVGYGFYEEERLRLIAALKKSAEIVGGVNIQNWITRFDQFRPVREERVVEEFLLQATDSSRMSKEEILFLESLLGVYQAYLRYPIFNVYDYAISERSGASLESNSVILSGQSGFETMPLLKAISKFSNIGNQIITEDRIKLKNQTEPARASVTNWLKVYREELGIRRHNSVERAKFLFESFNTKKLNSEERERIHSLIRSIEDDEPLTIDTKRQVIVFPPQRREETAATSSKPLEGAPSPDIFERFQNVSEPVPYREELKNVGTQTFSGGQIPPQTKNTEEQALLTRIKNMMVSQPKANAPAPKEEFQEIPTAPLAGGQEPLGTLRFSAKHVLPAERQSFTETRVTPKPLTPLPARLQPVKPSIVPPSPSLQSERDLAPEKQPSPLPSPPNTVPAVPPLERSEQNTKTQEPINMFRIKPSRE